MKQFFTFNLGGRNSFFLASVFALLLMTGFNAAYGQTLYIYTGTGSTYTHDTSVNLTSTTNLITVGSAATSATSCTDGFTASGFPADGSFASAVEVDMYANAGDTFNVTSFSVDLSRGTGPDSIELVYSPDGGTTYYYGGMNYLGSSGCDSTTNFSWTVSFSVLSSAYLIFDVFGFYADSTDGNLQVLNLSINGKPSGIVDTTVTDTTTIPVGDIFIPGQYVEIGIGTLGAFGTETAPPAGFNPDVYVSGYGAYCLGMVADPDMDGWSVGYPAYFGDYFLPGDPVEGWCIQANGTRNDAYYQNGAFTSSYGSGGLTLSGNTSSYTNTGGVMTGVWTGTAYGGLSITQTTVLDTNNLYFVTTVNLTNTGTDTLTGIYYMRECDPDQEEAWTGDFTTNNNIDYTGSDSVLVSATGTYYPSRSYLGLGTKCANATPFICAYDLLPSESEGLDALYNGTAGDVYYSGSTTQDVGVGLVFSVGDLAPGASTSIAYTYIESSSAVSSALNAICPTADTSSSTAVTNVPFEKGITISPNPAKDFIDIESDGNLGKADMTIYDMNGKKILQTQLELSNRNLSVPINLQDGVYVVELTSATGEKNIQQLVVLH